MNFVFRAAQR